MLDESNRRSILAAQQETGQDGKLHREAITSLAKERMASP
jgi:hypothetical protein